MLGVDEPVVRRGFRRAPYGCAYEIRVMDPFGCARFARFGVPLARYVVVASQRAGTSIMTPRAREIFQAKKKGRIVRPEESVLPETLFD